MTYPEHKIRTWITLTYDGDGMPVAHHLQQEGERSLIGQVHSKTEIQQEDDEDEDKKKVRLSYYDGLVPKYPAEKLVKALKKVKNKDEYFIYCDNNKLWPYAEQLLKAGFTKGIFPTQEDFDLEKEREDAMNFVEDNYPEVQIIPHQKVSSVEEARQIVQESDVPLVIQSEGDYVSTIVGPDDPEQSKITILAALDAHEQEYARGEIILKEKLIQPVEVTPEIIFWNGKPVLVDLDIETKNIGDGENNGCQVGCGSNLIIRTEFDDLLNQIAFPPKVYEMAAEHTGIFIWDISLYFTEKGIYFGEFCSNRFGYDAIFSEMTMAHGPSEFFGKIMQGVNPLTHFKFGTAVRVFDIKGKEGQEVTVGSWKPIWLSGVKAEDDKVKSAGDLEIAIVSGRGQNIQEAVDNLYGNYDRLNYKEKYCRTKADFLMDYPTSIIRRYKALNHTYFEGPDFMTPEDKHQEEMKSFKDKVKSKLYGIIR